VTSQQEYANLSCAKLLFAFVFEEKNGVFGDLRSRRSPEGNSDHEKEGLEDLEDFADEVAAPLKFFEHNQVFETGGGTPRRPKVLRRFIRTS
jgi:hypothetical protein